MTDLRERLAARRERLAAGLPPPDPVTVTPAFFAADIGTWGDCEICGTRFRKLGTETTCSLQCREVRKEKMRRSTSPKKPKWKPERMTCAAPDCEREFLPQGPRRVTCGNPWCQRAHHLRKQREYNQRYYEKRKKEAA